MSTKPATSKPIVPSPFGENVTLTLTIPVVDHKKAYQAILRKVSTRMSIPGFRKGKAPKRLAEESVGSEAIIRQVIEDLAPTLFAKAAKEAGIQPLVQPLISAKSLDQDKDWIIEATTAVAPIVDLKDWEKIVKKAGSEFDAKKKAEKMDEKQGKQERLSSLFGALINGINPKIPPLLFEHELNRQIEQFAKQLTAYKVGIDDYLKQTGKTIENIRSEYGATALASLQIEFILQEIERHLGLFSKKAPDSGKAHDHETEVVTMRKKTIEAIEAASRGQ